MFSTLIKNILNYLKKTYYDLLGNKNKKNGVRSTVSRRETSKQIKGKAISDNFLEVMRSIYRK
jgi:hypothetical protein